jgi:23S rRNA (uracil1939-C5)-methyltransferase
MKIMPFDILHLDPLGQGVSKVDQKVSFIPKTLPGEQGEMIIVEENNKVSFGKVKKFSKTSPERISPSCKHFNECGGCDYLHTDYSNELEYKRQAMLWLSKSLSNRPEPIVHPAPSRDAYRNRAQFHYDLEEQVIGYRVKKGHDILPIENCLLMKEDMQKFYKQISLSKLAENGRSKGHFEISQHHKGPIKFYVNERYAGDGFTQVNEPMNDLLKELVANKVKAISEQYHLESNSVIFDLFGGGGNLSEKLESFKVFVMDSFPPKSPNFRTHQQFIRCDLFRKHELKKLDKLPRPDIMLVDPPRSGFKELREIAEKFLPKAIIYVACEPAPLMRDIKELGNLYHFNELHLMDLFPGTRHFESMAIFSLK